MSNGKCSYRRSIHMLSFIYKHVFSRFFCNFEYEYSSRTILFFQWQFIDIIYLAVYKITLLTGFSFLRFMFKSGLSFKFTLQLSTLSFCRYLFWRESKSFCCCWKEKYFWQLWEFFLSHLDDLTETNIFIFCLAFTTFSCTETLYRFTKAGPFTSLFFSCISL